MGTETTKIALNAHVHLNTANQRNCHVLNAMWTTSLTCVEVAGLVRTLPVGVHSARRLGCLRLKVPNIAKFFVNRFYFVVIFCVQRIARGTKFMHRFGNL